MKEKLKSIFVITPRVPQISRQDQMEPHHHRGMELETSFGIEGTGENHIKIKSTSMLETDARIDFGSDDLCLVYKEEN